ncbi:GAF domain-containing protein [Humibacter antri]
MGEANTPISPTTGTDGDELCRRFVDMLPVTGAAITVTGGLGPSTIGVSDQIAAQLEELQFELGEGPHQEALHTGQPVLVPDLPAQPQARWPVFGAAAIELGIGALFTFPLARGAILIGAVIMYRNSPGMFDAAMVARARSLATSVAGSAIRLAALSAAAEGHTKGGLVSDILRREVHQATGMVLVQLGSTATEAFSRLQAHAFSSGQTVQQVAREVVERRLDFRDLTD